MCINEPASAVCAIAEVSGFIVDEMFSLLVTNPVFTQTIISCLFSYYHLTYWAFLLPTTGHCYTVLNNFLPSFLHGHVHFSLVWNTEHTNFVLLSYGACVICATKLTKNVFYWMATLLVEGINWILTIGMMLAIWWNSGWFQGLEPFTCLQPFHYWVHLALIWENTQPFI